MSIWNWTVDGDTPLCTAELNPKYGVQSFIHFNPEDIHFLVSNSDSQVIFYQWVSIYTSLVIYIENRFSWKHIFYCFIILQNCIEWLSWFLFQSDSHMEYFAPPLTDQDFNKPVGRYSQSIFQRNSTRVLTSTSIGNLVVWDTNKPLTKCEVSLIFSVYEMKTIRDFKHKEEIGLRQQNDKFILTYVKCNTWNPCLLIWMFLQEMTPVWWKKWIYFTQYSLPIDSARYYF